MIGMEWFLGSAFFLALYDLAKKASVRQNAVLHVLFFSTCFGCAAYAAATACRGGLGEVFAVSGLHLAYAFSKALIVATSWIFTFTALRTLPVSIATPIRASSPALVFLAALFLYGEVPSWAQGAGMLLVFAGYFAFSWAGKHEGIDFLRNKAVWCAVGGAVFSAVSSLWDKYVFQVAGAPVSPVQFWFQVGLVLTYGSLLLGKRAWGRRDIFEWRWTIPFVGILLAVADALYFYGLSIPEVPVSVASLVRRFSVVITFIFGARLFHETNLVRKSLALTLVLIGIALIGLF